MSEGQELLLVFAALYLWECCLWLPSGALLLRDGPRPGWRRPWGGHERRRAGFALASPWPWQATFVAQPWPFAVSPAGLLDHTVLALPPDLPPPRPGRLLPFDEVRRLTVEDGDLRVDGRGEERPLVLPLASPGAARWLAAELRAAAEDAPRARERRLERLLAEAASVRCAAEELARFRAVAAPVRQAGVALFVIVVAAFPALIVQLGLVRGWPFLAALYLVGLAVVLATFARAHRRLFPDARSERWQHLVVMALLPTAALRAWPTLARHALGCSHPLAAVLALGDGAPGRDLARLTLLDLRHPIVALGDEEAQRAARDVEGWFRERLRRTLEAEVAGAGHDLEALLAPPVRQDPTTRARCPRCAEEYRLTAGECSGCPGVTLRPFVDGP